MENRVLAGHEPALVLQYFEEICAIPHVSGDECAIADYVENFARSKGLFCYRDGVNNVFVKRNASAGCEGAPAVMLQGHLDMVGEKDAASTHNFATDGLRLSVDAEGWISADGTTLGGDDGVAVAMMLALLDTPPEPHPALECLFTVSEETGLEGAHAFNPTVAGATATRMINLDSECEGVLTAGCSGGVRTDITVPVASERREGVTVTVALSRFSGGHSGVEIHEGHTNAIKALGRILCKLSTQYEFALISVSGGGKDNAIPRDATATVLVADVTTAARLCADARAEAESMRAEPNVIAVDKDFTCTAEMGDKIASAIAMTAESTAQVLAVITLARDGVLAMSAHVKGLVAYSRNLGIIRTVTNDNGQPTEVHFAFATRSAVGSHLDDAERELCLLAKVCTAGKGSAVHSARYPGWDYAPVSPLRDVWSAVSERMYGITPTVEVIHAGLECGILSDKMPGMDIISIGPDMQDIHTPREKLSIPSVERTYRLVREVLRALATHL